MSKATSEKEQKIPRKLRSGILTAMAQNHIAANLIMFLFIAAGLFMLPSLRRELMPQVDPERIMISASYPGSTPDEVEEGIIIAMEEAVRGINGVKTITSTSSEGSGSVQIELLEGANIMRVRNDIERAVAQISSFPDDMEVPQVREMTRQQAVMEVLVNGDVDKQTLREAAEQVRDDILTLNGISVAELNNVENPEIAVEISQTELKKYGLTIQQIASAIGVSSVDLSAGRIKAHSGEVLLRTEQRKRTASDFEQVILKTGSDGRIVRLGDVAKLTDGYEDSDYSSYFNGKPAIGITIYCVGDETPVGVSDAARAYFESREGTWPEGISVDVRSDRAESYRVRIDLLMSNAIMGLALVLLFLGVFLDIRLAFWTAVGMVVSFVGAIAVMVFLGVSFNMISLFAFILALGIVVDDAIVVGESVYVYRQQGDSGTVAAVKGLHEVASPVVFSVLTTIITFIPLLFLPGMLGKTYHDLPVIVIIILTISILESMLVLPAHLSGMKKVPDGFLGLYRIVQEKIANGVEYLIQKYFRKVMRLVVKSRYVIVALSIAVIVATIGYVASGRMRYTMMPEVEGDTVKATIRLPQGSHFDQMKAVEEEFLKKTQNVIEDKKFGRDTVKGVFSRVSGGNSASVDVYLTPATERNYVSSEFAAAWRKEIGEIPGVEALSFRFNQGPGGGGAGLQFELSHRDTATLERAAVEVAARLSKYEGVKDVDAAVSLGKEQISFKLKPEALSLGVTERDFARQLRAAVFGAEGIRQQRGRNEVKVQVRYPLSERETEYLIENFLVQTPSGGEIPLLVAATMERGHAYKSISRKNGRRLQTVSAEIDGAVTTIEQLAERFQREEMPELQQIYPGLTFGLGGMHADSAETNSKMRLYFLMSLFAMFAIMAVSTKSYVKPLMIMVSIPFGIIGAIIGHIIFGYNLSLISLLGMIALSGVVVNDSIVLVDVINDFQRNNVPLNEAIVEGAVRRFRAISLTTLTTFLGVFPMILETSKEARFLIPMAISLGVGVLFASIVTLFIVPANFLILRDLHFIKDVPEKKVDKDYTETIDVEPEEA